MASTIETHPQRQKIIDALISGETPQSISSWVTPRLSHVAIWRYKRKALRDVAVKQAGIVKALEDKGLIHKDDVSAIAAADAVKDVMGASLRAEPIIARMEKLRLDRERIKGLAEAGKDLRTWSALDRNDISHNELEARLTGALSDGPRDSASVRLVVLPVISAPAGPMPCIPGRDVTFKELPAGDTEPDGE